MIETIIQSIVIQGTPGLRETMRNLYLTIKSDENNFLVTQVANRYM